MRGMPVQVCRASLGCLDPGRVLRWTMMQSLQPQDISIGRGSGISSLEARQSQCIIEIRAAIVRSMLGFHAAILSPLR